MKKDEMIGVIDGSIFPLVAYRNKNRKSKKTQKNWRGFKKVDLSRHSCSLSYTQSRKYTLPVLCTKIIFQLSNQIDFLVVFSI